MSDSPDAASTTAESTPLTHLVDTARYPLAEPESPVRRRLIEDARRALAADGCTVLRDFIRPELQETLRTECAGLAPQAHFDVETVNVYNIAANDNLPADHPGRIPFPRGNAFVPRDRIPAEAVIAVLYREETFRAFLAECFDLPVLHELADPLSALVLNVVEPGMEHPWHFDTNEFTVSMLTQEADEGGVFEYCPGIRSATDERFDDVRDVLTGRDERLVQRLTLRPGDLQLFRGRYSLHRVSPVAGETARHSAIFAYSERPGVVGSVARTRQLFGRALPAHLDAERRVRGDALLD